METLTIGPKHTFAQNVVYALPARACYLFTTTTTGFEVSTQSTTGFTALTITNNGALVGPGFIRNTGTGVNAYLKAL